MSEIKKQSFNNIDTLRKIKNMSVMDLVKALGYLSTTTYYRWKDGAKISGDDIVKLTQLFGVSSDCILGLCSIEYTEPTIKNGI